MSSVPMRRLEIVALKRDMNEVLECLGHAGCFQLLPPGSGAAAVKGGAAAPAQGKAEGGAFDYSSALDELEELRRSLGLRYPEHVPAGTKLPGAEEEAALKALRSRASAIEEAAARNAEEAAKLREALEESRLFAGVDLPYRSLDQLQFLTVRIGRVAPDGIPPLAEALGAEALVLPLGTKGDLIAVSSKSTGPALDSALTLASFAPRQLSSDFEGVSRELPDALERKLAELERRRNDLEKEREGLREAVAAEWEALAASYAVAASVEEARSSLEASAQAYRLEGWAPAPEVSRLGESISRRTDGRAALRSFVPGELPSSGEGEEDVPVLLEHRGLVASFERMVLSFGVPQYGGIDPTPLVAVFFVLFFTIMFGDLGQGFLIFAGAFAIRRGFWMGKWKAFAPIGMACGAGSMLMGFLTGSFFTFESALVPFTRAVSGTLFGAPVDRFLSLMPSGGGGKILPFFGFTLGLGVLVNSMGLAINIVDRFREGKAGEALFSKTGLAGALFFWWAIGMGARGALGFGFGWWDGLGLGLPLAALAFEERLACLVEGKEYRNPDGAFAAAVKGFVAILESVSYFLSNTLSFLRVGAFALSHVVLSFIIFSMGEMVGKGEYLGPLWRTLVVLAGNGIIVFLEGMIVAIQVVRLQYYEFLSKFLTETGSPFVPFKFQFRKEQP